MRWTGPKVRDTETGDICAGTQAGSHCASLCGCEDYAEPYLWHKEVDCKICLLIIAHVKKFARSK